MKVCPITGVEWTKAVQALPEEWMQEEIAALLLEGRRQRLLARFDRYGLPFVTSSIIRRAREEN